MSEGFCYTDATCCLVQTPKVCIQNPIRNAEMPTLLVGNNKIISTWIGIIPNYFGWSQRAIAYQEFVTGTKAGTAFEVGGVRFDGVRNNTLLEAKSSYDNFVNKKTGGFYSWFKGQNSLVTQARNQIKAANGSAIE
jgi:hypothetical protein